MQLRVDEILGVEPISLDDAKLHLRIDGNVENALIEGLIIAARQRCEGELKRALIEQRRILLTDVFPCEIDLGPDVSSIVSITYRDAADATQPLDASAYRVAEERTLVPVSAWPAGDTVRITFVCGAYDDTNFPAALKSWMLLHIGAMYSQREAVANGQMYEPPGRFVDGLLDPYRSY